MKYITLILSALCLSFFLACGDDDNSGPTVSAAEQREIDLEKIQQYVTANNLTVREKDDVSIATIEEGSGAQPSATSNVSVRYIGKLLDGTVFDQSSTSVIFQLNRLIPGWQIGIPCMKEKETASLIIPSYLGYGTQGAGSIPPNSVLVFDITLDSVLTN